VEGRLASSKKNEILNNIETEININERISERETQRVNYIRDYSTKASGKSVVKSYDVRHSASEVEITFAPVANATAGVLVSNGIEIPILEMLEGAGLYAAQSALGNVIKSLPYASGALLLGSVLHNSAEFQSKHLFLNEDIDEILNNPLVSQATKSQILDNIRNDSLFSSSTERDEYIDLSDIFEKRKYDDKQEAKKSSFKDSAIFGNFPDPDSDNELEELDAFDPSEEGNHDKILRDERFGKLYRDAKDSKVWYSKERSGDRAHGGEHWKQFRECGKYLEHEADVDMTGKVMNKWKSNTGSKIKIKDLLGIK
jgi:hypothetical protein